MFGNVIPCNYDTQGAQFMFTFGGSSGPSINVDLSEMITPLVLLDGSDPPTFDDGSVACQFGIEAADGRPLIFGDSFLRSAYVVYDLDKNQIGLAQTNFNATGSDIQEIGISIPATTTATSASVIQTATAMVGVTGDQTATRSEIQILSTGFSSAFVTTDTSITASDHLSPESSTVPHSQTTLSTPSILSGSASDVTVRPSTAIVNGTVVSATGVAGATNPTTAMDLGTGAASATSPAQTSSAAIGTGSPNIRPNMVLLSCLISLAVPFGGWSCLGI